MIGGPGLVLKKASLNFSDQTFTEGDDGGVQAGRLGG